VGGEDMKATEKHKEVYNRWAVKQTCSPGNSVFKNKSPEIFGLFKNKGDAERLAEKNDFPDIVTQEVVLVKVTIQEV
jgi:hypothetical protein